MPFAEEYNVDEPEIEESVAYIVMDADSSQFSTLVDVANGKNLAVQGPPGTGKSQTIVNAIAAALVAGKKSSFRCGEVGCFERGARALGSGRSWRVSFAFASGALDARTGYRIAAQSY